MHLTEHEQKTINTYNSFALEWSDTHNTHIYQPEMDYLKKLLPVGKILEVGSGNGRDAKALIALGYDYIGTDISESLLKIAQSNNPGAKFLLKSVYDLDFSIDQFDGFWCSAMLLHIPKSNIDQALQSIKKYVRGEGIGFISIKDGKGESIVRRTNSGFNDERFFSFYSKRNFSKILTKNNFEIIKTQTVTRGKTIWLYFFVKVLK